MQQQIRPDCMAQGALSRLRVSVVLTLVFGLAFLGPAMTAPAAHAGVHNLIPANQNEEPTESFRADDALFFYATSDIKGGRVCVVPAEGELEGLSCDGSAWGKANTVGGVGTVYSLLEPPYLRVGTWRLLAETIPPEEGQEPEPTAVSQPFTVTPCGDDCDKTIASDIVNAFKAGALAHYEIYYHACAAMVLNDQFKALRSRFNEVTKPPRTGIELLANLGRELKQDKEFKWDFGSGAVVGFSGGSILSVSFLSPQDVIRHNEKKAIAILKTLTCTLGAAYSDLAHDPPDPEYALVEEPTTRPVVPLGSMATDAHAQSVDTELGLGLALLRRSSAIRRRAMPTTRAPFTDKQRRWRGLGSIS